MKRLFTIAVVAMAASLTFAQAPLAKKSAASGRLEQMANIETLAKKAKETKELQAAMAEKAAAAKETSTSMLRKSSVNRGLFNSIDGKVIKTWMLGGYRSYLSNMPYKSTARKTTTQEGNVTVTTDAHGIITNVTGVEPKMYERSNSGLTFYTSGQDIYYANQSGMVTIVEDGDNVYIKNPISRLELGTWVRGTKSGNTITIATHQPLSYNANYDATISLRWGAVPNNGNIGNADSHAENFTFTVSGDVLTLEDSESFLTATGDSYFMGWFWDDDNSWQGNGDQATVLTYNDSYVAPSTELVTLPAGVEYTGWYMNYTSDQTLIKNQSVNVAFAGNDVYVQGISTAFPDAWVKGTIDGTTVKFDKFQYVGAYNGAIDCWFVGVNPATGEMKDAMATYDAAAKTITFADDVLINAATDRVYYLNWFSDITISAEEVVYEEPVLTDLTATLPYLNTFDTEEEQAQVAIYDANKDNSTFSFYTHTTTKSMTARYRYNTSNAADDYIVFPGVEMKAGTKYKIALDAAAYGPNYPERLEVVAGKVAKASELTIPVIPATVVDTQEFNTLSNDEFTVAEDGTYYIAVHAISDEDKFYLYVDNFSISTLDASAPANITDLTAVADAQGANKATVTFTVPSQTINGESLTGEIDIVVKRDGEEIFSGKKAAGESVVINDDNVPAAGYYTYSVTASYGEHVGNPAEIKIYIGYDTPDVVNNLTIDDKSGAVALAWEAPTGGAEGYIVNPADYTYNVYPVSLMEFLGMTFPVTDYNNPYATGLKETSATVTYNTNEGEHTFTYFAVTANNTTGESDDTYAAVVTGAPYEMPVFESAADGSLSYWWGTAKDSKNSSLGGGLSIGENASDGDGYCFQMAAKTMGWINLQSGKIALAGTANPTLTFDYASDNNATLTVSVITPNGEKEVATLTPAADYAPATISLVEFANEDWVRVIITGTFPAAGNAYIDNIRVYNMLDNNLVAKGIKATSSVLAGEDVTVNVEIENQGSNAVEEGAYTVDLYCNDTKVKSLPGTALASNAKTTFEFTETTDVMTPEVLEWKAVIVFDADDDQSNNTTATAKTTIKTNKYPAVTDLAGAQVDNTVKLTWSEPDMTTAPSEPVTDDFESYEGFTTVAGEWTFVDVDNAEVGGFTNLDFTVNGENILQSLQSFWVHDVTDGDKWNTIFAAHSGNKYLASMFRYDDGKVDDWAISPALSGDAQTVSFYARSYHGTYLEKIEVLYSTGSKNIADFVSVRAEEVVPAEWTEYTAELPAGAKYFAIRSCATSSFMLMIDDVTYIPGGASAADLALVGYNVYRDGVKLNAEPVEETTYTDASVTEGEYSYVVTVVYDKGESKISNVVTITVSNATGIDGIAANTTKVSVNNKTITVANADGKNVSICTIDGKMVYNANCQDAANVHVENGIYIVKVGNTVVKTVVK